MWNDLRFAFRTLRRSPLFTSVTVLSLALGIGANTSIFSLLDQVLLRMLPIRDPANLVVFRVENEQAPGMSMSDNFQTVYSYPMYRDLRDRCTVFEGVIARAGAPVSVSYGGETERASAEIVSGNFFQVLGVRSFLGRMLTEEDDRTPGAHPVAVLSYGYWAGRFGANPAVLNQKISVNGHPTAVIGVAPPGFRGIISGKTPEVFVPVAMKRQATPTWDGLQDRRVRWLNIFARPKPGISRRQAETAAQTVFRAILADELAQIGRLRSRRAEDRFLAQRLELWAAAQGINQLRRSWQAPLVALMAMVGLVLLIACANIANLLLARAAGRRREVAIRLALGAGRAAIARQMLIEGVVLALAGGLLGLLVATWTTEGMLRLLPEGAMDGWLSAGVDLRVLGFTVLLSAATGLLFGLAPALQASRSDVSGAVKEQSASLASRTGQTRLRRALVAAQFSLSLLLVAGAGLFARSLVNLARVDPGFRTEKLLTFSVDPRLCGYDAPRGFAFYRELRERLAGIPGVRVAGAANPAPLSGDERGGNLTIEGYQVREDEDVGAGLRAISPGYFRALGVPLLAGREFTVWDDAGAPKVVIVNEAFVRRYLGNQNPIGRRIAFGAGNRIKLDREIVGVAGNMKHSNLREHPRPVVYFPYPQDERLEGLSFYVRTDRDENEIASEVRRLVQQMDASLPVFNVSSVKVQVEESIFRERLIAVLAGAFGILATVLAALGLYGVLAYTVARRTAEIGLRIALGATRGAVLNLVIREAGMLALAGIAAGLPASLALSRFVESQLFGVTGSDPAIFAGAALALAAVALLAACIPGLRASRIDPMIALRYE